MVSPFYGRENRLREVKQFPQDHRAASCQTGTEATVSVMLKTCSIRLHLELSFLQISWKISFVKRFPYMATWADTEFTYLLDIFQVDIFIEQQIVQLPFIQYFLRGSSVLTVLWGFSLLIFKTVL